MPECIEHDFPGAPFIYFVSFINKVSVGSLMPRIYLPRCVTAPVPNSRPVDSY